MKLGFCAVCGTTEGLHQHHIEPVVMTNINRKRKKGYDDKKPLKDCESTEVFAWLFDRGIITDDGEITVCDYHHNILHGIVKFQMAEHTKLIKMGLEKARDNGVILGRPTKIDEKLVDEVFGMRNRGQGIKSIAKEKEIGIGTIYKILEGNYTLQQKQKESTFLDLYD